jgi:formiminotetrahydrofolate cyclodeaminase
MRDVAIGEWLGTLAERTPTPGGGAVAALAAAAAAALIGMVTAYTQGDRWADRQDRMRALGVQAEGWRVSALLLAEEDAQAFAAVGQAYAMPKDSEAQRESRRAAVQQALAGAAGPPTRTAELAGLIVQAAEELVSLGNPNVVSDVGVAAAMAEAALTGARLNIAANAALLTDAAVKAGLSDALATAARDVERARAVSAAVSAALST